MMSAVGKLNNQLAVGAMLAVALMGSPHGATAQRTASPACECIDPWSTRSAAAQQLPITGTLGARRQDVLTAPPHSVFPATYGAQGCAAQDSQLDQVCVTCVNGHSCKVPPSGQPDWCASQWCYVNASTCERPFSYSDVNFDPEVEAPDDLAYSYETCGNLDSYAAQKHFTALNGKTLRVGARQL